MILKIMRYNKHSTPPLAFSFQWPGVHAVGYLIENTALVHQATNNKPDGWELI
jgi:hypothetical protein